MNKKIVAKIIYYSAPAVLLLFLCSIVFFILVLGGADYQFAFRASIALMVVSLISVVVVLTGIHWQQWAEDNKD